MNMDELRDDILASISSLPKQGVPGTLVAYGPNARPLISAGDQNGVIVGVAELGDGRVAVVTHDYLLKDFGYHRDNNIKTLQMKLHEFVSFKQEKKPISIKRHEDMEDLLKSRDLIGVVIGGDTPNGEDVLGLEQYIRNGGGLVYGVCPWGWLQVHPGCSEDDLPLYDILEQCGIHLTSHYVFTSEESYKISSPVNAHLPALLEDCKQGAAKLEEHAHRLCTMLKDLPFRILQSSFRESLLYFDEEAPNEIAIPCKDSPVESGAEKGKLLLDCLISHLLGTKAPGISSFPGDFESNEDVERFLKCIEVDLDSIRSDIFPSAVYLPAGETLEIEVNEGSKEASKWKVLVGAHQDDLTDLEKWDRLPRIHVSQFLSDDSNMVFSPYGGSVYFQSPDGPSHLNVSLSNVIETPCYDLKTSSWIASRDAPGLWGDLVGFHVVITLPTPVIKEIKDVKEALVFWDMVVATHHKLRTTDVNEHKKQWIVPDIKPSVGYMHSGYPIVTHMDIADPQSEHFILNVDRLRENGNWGLYHEIGHNMQRPEWTFAGTGEVTVNIFTLHSMDQINGIRPFNHPWLKNQMEAAKKYLEDGANFEEWKRKPGVALCVYAQIAHHLGWGTYKAVFRCYEEMDVETKPNTDETKISTWIKTVSECCGHNLCPLFKFWGIPFALDLSAQLKDLPAFLPVDAMTSLAPNRMETILADFEEEGGCMDSISLPNNPCKMN